MRDQKTFSTDDMTVLNSTVAWDFSGYYAPTNYIDIDSFVIYESERLEKLLKEIA